MTKASEILAKVKLILQALLEDPQQSASGPLFNAIRADLPTDVEELKGWAVTQFPAVAVLVELPKPEKFHWKPDSRGPLPGFHSAEVSFSISLRVYAIENVDPNAKALWFTERLWAAFAEDTTLGGLVEKAMLLPQAVGFSRPYLFALYRLDTLYRADKNAV